MAYFYQLWPRILVHAELRIFATPMLADRLTYENRLYLGLSPLTRELRKFAKTSACEKYVGRAGREFTIDRRKPTQAGL